MNNELARIVKKISGDFLCVFEGQSSEFSCAEEFEKSEFSKNKIATSISTQDGKIVIELGEWKTPLAKLSNEDWDKDYEKQFGTEPSFS